MGSPKSDPNPERRLIALTRALKVLREAAEPAAMIEVALEHLHHELNYSLLWLGTYDRDSHRITSRSHIAPKKDRLLTATFGLSPGDLVEQVVIQQRPLIVNDLQSESRAGDWSQLAERLQVRGALLFPMRYRDACHGLVLLGSPHWGQSPTQSERSFLSAILSALAESLQHYEQAQQQQQQKRPELSIFNLVNQVDDQADFDQQLEIILTETHRFIEADRVRLLWFAPQTFNFWERLATQSRGRLKRSTLETTPLTIGADTIRGAYQALCNNQLVVGELQGLVVVNLPEHLMKSLQARSLLAAPIMSHGDLKGFITVEAQEARIWEADDKTYITAASRLAGLMAPASTLSDSLDQKQADQQFLMGLARSIHSDADWQATLGTCGDHLCERFEVSQFMVLLHDAERGGYEVTFQREVKGRRGTTLRWLALDEVDWQMLERSAHAISINDLSTDLKLLAWRENLQTLGIQSLLACNVSPGHAPEAIILVASPQMRHWTPAEGELLMAVGQQLDLILHQWQLQRQLNQQEQLYDSIQWGLQTLQRTFQPDQLEASTNRHIAELLQVPLIAVLHWDIGEHTAQINHFMVRHKDFGADGDISIALESDALINWALQTDGLIPVTFEDFPPATQAWIWGPTESKFLLMALRTAPDHICNGVLVLADHRDRKWSDYHLSLVTLLANQLAWSRRHLNLTEMLLTQREELEQLNWYKHKRFDEVHRRLEVSVQRLEELTSQTGPLVVQRQQQQIRQLGSLVHGMTHMLTHEQWQLTANYQTTPLISLLNRLMERASPLIRERHLWSKVHNDSNAIIGGDIVKIEFVLYELLVAACKRSPDQGRIDVWCRPMDRNTLELSITDDGDVPDLLLSEVLNGRPEDILAPSTLDAPPGLHFAICQTLMQQIGGEFSLQKLEDKRMMSRIVLAIASKGNNTPPNRDNTGSAPFSRNHGR
ncbi:MAG: GAF domain-containing protein [Leptolyngbyaceae cyanobacterium]